MNEEKGKEGGRKEEERKELREGGREAKEGGASEREILVCADCRCF